MFEKCDSSIKRNGWLLFSAFQQSLQQKLVFVLTQENAFSHRFHFKANRKSIGSFKIGIFKKALHLALQNSSIGMLLCDNHWKF